jgi:hypothetical protein
VTVFAGPESGLSGLAAADRSRLLAALSKELPKPAPFELSVAGQGALRPGVNRPQTFLVNEEISYNKALVL